MTILKNDYLYNYILKYILNHLYTISLPFTTPYEYDENLEHAYYETIQYALVSKKFFQFVSNNLTSLMKFKNYDILKPFIEKRKSKTSELYSLIKLEGSTIIYDSLEDYERDEKLGLISKYRKCLVSLEDFNNDYQDATKRSINYLLSEKVYPDNVQFNIELSIKGSYASSGTRSSSLFNSELFNYDFNLLLKNISKKRISILYIDYYNQDNIKLFQNFTKLNPKNIVYINEDEEEYDDDDLLSIHSNFTPLFQYSKSLKSLEFQNDYLDPHHLLGIDNKTTSLKVLHMRMKFNTLIRGLNGDSGFFNNGSLFERRNVQKDWNDMITILSNNNTIRYLVLEEYECFHDQFEKQIKTSCITDGFKLLLSNPKCLIETLEFNCIDFIDNLFITALKKNQSVSTLIFIDTNPKSIIQQVLPVNKRIKNLIFYKIKLSQFFELIKTLKKYQNTNNYIDLYSVTLNLDWIDIPQVKKIEDEFKNNSLSIKEFNIYIKRYTPKTKQQIIINNSIINFRFKSKQ